MESADKLVEKTLEIIHYFHPKMWWIENPRTGYLKTRPIMDHIPYVDIDYCQFSDWGYQKPTRFWGSPNIVQRPNVVCDFHSCPNCIDGPYGRKRHRLRLGGYKMQFSTRQKGRIPEKVVEYLLEGLVDRPRDHNKRKWVPKTGDHVVQPAGPIHSLGGGQVMHLPKNSFSCSTLIAPHKFIRNWLM